MRVAARARTRRRGTSFSQISVFISRTKISLSFSLSFVRSYHTQKRVLQIINHARKSARGHSHFALVWNTGTERKREGKKREVRLSKSQKDSKRRQVHVKGRLAPYRIRKRALFPGHLPSTDLPSPGSKENREIEMQRDSRVVTALILLMKKYPGAIPLKITGRISSVSRRERERGGESFRANASLPWDSN